MGYNKFALGEVEFGSWFDHTLGWWQRAQNSDRILWMTYESLHDNVHIQIKRIAEFLGVAADDRLIDAVAIEAKFDNMREQSSNNIILKKDAAVTDKPKTNFFRKGEVGDWRNHFSEQENQEFDRLYTEKIAGSGLTFDF